MSTTFVLTSPTFTTPQGRTILIRTCRGFEELDACVQLQIDVWGYSDGDVIPRRVFTVTQKIGGQVLGAFDVTGGIPDTYESLIGFAMSIPAVRPVQVDGQQRRGIRPDGHQRSVAERYLAAQPDQVGQPGDRRHVGGDLRELEVPERAELDRQDQQHDREQQRGGGVAGQSHDHTRRTEVVENSPDGLTIRTRTSTASPNSGTRSEPR